jgi:hypothetical protein
MRVKKTFVKHFVLGGGGVVEVAIPVTLGNECSH